MKMTKKTSKKKEISKKDEEMNLETHNPIRDKYEEMILDLRYVCRNSGIKICDCDCNQDAIVKLDCSKENSVLYSKGQFWGNFPIHNILYRYNVAIKWINDDECHIYPCEMYFNLVHVKDYRVIYPNYKQMTIELKRLFYGYDVAVYTMNDNDFFTSTKHEWFEKSDAVFIIRDDEDDYSFDLNSKCIDDDCINARIHRFKTKHNLTLKYIDITRNLLGFFKPENCGDNDNK